MLPSDTWTPPPANAPTFRGCGRIEKQPDCSLGGVCESRGVSYRIKANEQADAKGERVTYFELWEDHLT